MKKGISFYFGYEKEPAERAKLIKDAGFDNVITNADKRFNSQNGSIRRQVKIFKKAGLGLSSLHMQYRADFLHYFWEKGIMGEKLKKRLIKDVNLASKYGFSCVVVHLDGNFSSLGKKRLLDVLKVCEKKNIPLAIENIHNQPLFVKVFEEIDSPYMKFCYDSGHNNVFDKDFDYLDRYAGKLIALHLHDNDGTADKHTLSRFNGAIDWDKIGHSLAKIIKNNPKISLDYEIMMREGKDEFSLADCLAEVKKQADALEKIINDEIDLLKKQ